MSTSGLGSRQERQSVRLFAFAVVCLWMALGGIVYPSLAAAQTSVVLDSTGGVDLTTQFSIYGSSGPVVATDSAIGPKFEIFEPTEITHIGVFARNCYVSSGEAVCPGGNMPFVVEIYASNGGIPNVDELLGVFTMTNDGNPFDHSFEYAEVGLWLEPGTYFALFRAQNGDRGGLMSNAQSPFEYQFPSTELGYINFTEGTVFATANHIGVVILGEEERSFCIGDLNGDRRVGWYDLMLLFHLFGPCDNCAADFNGNGHVGWHDAIYLYHRFGICD